jgi:hypothetical protein
MRDERGRWTTIKLSGDLVQAVREERVSLLVDPSTQLPRTLVIYGGPDHRTTPTCIPLECQPPSQPTELYVHAEAGDRSMRFVASSGWRIVCRTDTVGDEHRHLIRQRHQQAEQLRRARTTKSLSQPMATATKAMLTTTKSPDMHMRQVSALNSSVALSDNDTSNSNGLHPGVDAKTKSFTSLASSQSQSQPVPPSLVRQRLQRTLQRIRKPH